MDLQKITYRQKICISCSTKRCCFYYVVPLTGADVSRIAGALQLFPEDFVTYYEPQTQGGALFRLSPEGPLYAMILAKREVPDKDGAPCLFLVQTNDGHARCGLHDLRPLQCETYPVVIEDGSVDIINDPAGCVRTWSYGDIDVIVEKKRLQQLKSLEMEHARMVEKWNRHILEEGMTHGFDEFCAYLLNCCRAQEDSP